MDISTQQRRIESITELSRRAGAAAPRIVLLDNFQLGLAISATFQADDVRRLHTYFMHPETYQRACRRAAEEWGVLGNFFGAAGVERAVSHGGEYVMHVAKPLPAMVEDEPYRAATVASYEWRVALNGPASGR
jgi:hypothetical protein